jgi:hypothetical protein
VQERDLLSRDLCSIFCRNRRQQPHCLTKIFLCRIPMTFFSLAYRNAATRLQACSYPVAKPSIKRYTLDKRTKVMRQVQGDLSHAISDCLAD